MKPSGLRFFSFLASFVLIATLEPQAAEARASNDSDARDVLLSHVEGDVRLSRGDGKHIKLNREWEEAQSGEPMEEGFALATGNGTAEIEFENGSMVYLAENSLLFFNELSFENDRLNTQLSLPTGAAAFALQTSAAEIFSVQTPTDHIRFAESHKYFLRLDAYLDATRLTPLGGDLASLARLSRLPLVLDYGSSILLQGGRILSDPQPSRAVTPQDSDSANSAEMEHLQAKLEKLRDAGALESSALPEDFAGLDSLESQSTPSPQSVPAESRLVGEPAARGNWDQSVESREQARQTTLAAALKASGLSSPVAGLTEMYRHGTFLACEPYGTCWEPQEGQPAQAADTKAIQRDAQAPATQASNTGGFQPQTVQWQENDWGGPCDFSGGSRTITRVARTQEELENLQRLKAKANSSTYFPGFADESCYSHRWLFRHGHYAMVLPRTPPPCSGGGCKPVHPVHPPRPVLVRVGNKVGFVPRHPDDVKGKPPINLKNGIILVPTKPGEPPQRMAWDPRQKLTYLDKSPREMQREFSARTIPVAPPLIRAHLADETTRGLPLSAANHTVPPIAYDYKSQKFMMPAGSGAKAERVPVGGIGSNGRVETFASNQPGRYAESSGHTSAGASYGGGSYASHSSSSGSSGGSSAGGSSSGSSFHSSGGGGSASSAGSSSASGSSGGGRPH
jgi:FecR protein